MNMKQIVCLALLSIAASASAQTVIAVAPAAVSNPALTAKNATPQQVRELCVQAVRREETVTKKIYVEDVSLTPSKMDTIVTCVVKATAEEGPGVVMRDGPITRTDERYSVRVDLSTGNTKVERVDEDAATQVALTAVANAFIAMKPTVIATDDVTFAATVGDNACLVEVAIQATDEPRQWLVKKLDCKRR